MPTFKHPCPHCGTYINRDAVACPACGRRDPFAPSRCPACQTPIEDPGWVACPKCGTALAGAASPAVAGGTAAAPTGGVSPAPPSTGPAPRVAACTGCGSPLPAGARFCRECGTLAG